MSQADIPPHGEQRIDGRLNVCQLEHRGAIATIRVGDSKWAGNSYAPKLVGQISYPPDMIRAQNETFEVEPEFVLTRWGKLICLAQPTGFVFLGIALIILTVALPGLTIPYFDADAAAWQLAVVMVLQLVLGAAALSLVGFTIFVINFVPNNDFFRLSDGHWVRTDTDEKQLWRAEERAKALIDAAVGTEEFWNEMRNREADPKVEAAARFREIGAAAGWQMATKGDEEKVP